MPMSPAERQLRARHAALVRWSRPGATADHARRIVEAQLAQWETEVDPDGRLDPAERRLLAERARKAYFARLALRSARARRAKAAARTADQQEAGDEVA